MNIINKTSFPTETIPNKGPDGKHFVTIIVKGTFATKHGQVAARADDQMPIAYSDEPFDPKKGGSIKFEADLAPFKPRADIVLVGHAYALPGALVNSLDAAIKVGVHGKTLRIYGNRFWRCPALSAPRPSEPEAFTKMPMVYEKAFGGMDKLNGGYCPENMVGIGYWSKVDRKIIQEKPLPNIEDPKALIQSPEDKPKPVGFGYYGRAWAPRAGYLGTYDENWRKQRAPEPPLDFKYDYHNAAHPDLQIKGYLRGDEPVSLHNLTPDGTLQFRLPGVSISCMAEKSYDLLVDHLEKTAPGHPSLESLWRMPPEKTAVTMHLDTLCLMPDEKRCYLIWRGRVPVFDTTALEVKEILIEARG
ncbi:MAG: DUF2169 domain-containing protein [Desulfobacteraceae bacterium]|nr:DUF2169 domain-containing protein [Desulfobacteraceae bacterium]